MNETQRVDIDDLDYDEQNNLTLHKGKPFSGKLTETDSNGNLVEMAEYVRGISHGIQQSWHSSGQIETEGFTKKGIAHGVWKSWHSNGQLAEETEFDNAGNQMYLRRWNSEGEIIEDAVFHERLRPLVDPEANF